MDPPKRTRRDVRPQLSLEEHIAVKRAELVRERKDATLLLARSADIRARIATLTRRYQKRLASELDTRCAALEEEARARQSMEREYNFESIVVSYLRMHQLAITHAAPVSKSESIHRYQEASDLKQTHQTRIMDEYFMEIDCTPAKVAMAARDECPRCDAAPKLLTNHALSVMSCPVCGYTVTYLDTTSAATAFDEVVEFSQYSYKRVNHMMMWLTLVQGKESHRVPDDVMTRVMQDIYARGVRDPDVIDQKLVHKVLRKLRLRKAYEHVAQITTRISGRPPPRVSTAVEEQLKNMFLQMQPAFHRYAPKGRVNFLSYSYVLYRCFQILGQTHMLNSLTLLKGREKLVANDAIFTKMCRDLGWPVFALPPEGDTARVGD